MYPRRMLFTFLLLLGCAVPALADIKIKSRSSFGGQPGPETTTYIKGKRQRAEMPGQMATVTQCDLRRTVQMNGATRTFIVSPFDDPAAATETPATAPAPRATAPARRGGLITTTMTATDTGERKQMFGYTARRIKTSMVTESSPDSCNPQKMRMETDGWYIDLNVEFNCYEQSASSYRAPAQAGGCQDTHRTKQVGTARTGYPVHVTTTIHDEASGRTTSFTQEVVEISKATLDAALFEVPSDYREVRDYSEMYAGAATPRSDEDGGTSDDDTNEAPDAGTNETVDASPAARPSAETPPPAPARAEPKRSGGGLKSRLKGLRFP